MEYFVTSEAFRRIKNKSKSIVVGRKGAEKSALRKKLEEYFSNEQETYLVNVSPQFSSIRNILKDRDVVKNYGEEIFFQHVWSRQSVV